MAAFMNVQLQFSLSDDEDEEIELENHRMRYELRIERSGKMYLKQFIIDKLTPYMRSARRTDSLSIEKKIASTIAFLVQGLYQRHVDTDFVMQLP